MKMALRDLFDTKVVSNSTRVFNYKESTGYLKKEALPSMTQKTRRMLYLMGVI